MGSPDHFLSLQTITDDSKETLSSGKSSWIPTLQALSRCWTSLSSLILKLYSMIVKIITIATIMSIINFKKHCIWTTYIKNYITKNLSMQSQH